MCPHLPRGRRLTHRTGTLPAPWPFTPEQGWSLLCNGVIVFDDLGGMRKGAAGDRPGRC
jgi:Family of unknown function (DUF5999)